MKLIDLLELFREPNPSGYVELVFQEGSSVLNTAQALYNNLSDRTLHQEVMRIAQSTKASTFPVLKIYIKEETEDE